jgi:hypothetical protein
MLLHSRIPPKHLWPEIEQDLRREGLCIHEELPRRLFCGKPAISATESGPRCEEHLRAN